jgi:hypothetical protein
MTDILWSSYMEIPNDWFSNERGNTWLMDDDGNHVAWLDVTPTVRMEVSICPGNYPGLSVSILSEEESTDEHLADHIQGKCVGWHVRKCNIEGVEIDADGMVIDSYANPER